MKAATHTAKCCLVRFSSQLCFLKSGAAKDDTADADNADQDGEEDDADAASDNADAASIYWCLFRYW